MIRVPQVERPDAALTHRHSLRVVFGDTDAAGIVYYANYLRFFESGRAELMRAVGLPYREIVSGGLVLPVVEAWCRYRAPARYDDLVEITSWVHELRAASMLIAHQVHRDGELLAEGAARIGCMNGDGTPRRLPDQLRQLSERSTFGAG